MICAHSPTEEADDTNKDAFYAALEQTYDAAPGHDSKVLMGDFNAKIGKETIYRPTIGKESLHDVTNDNGLRLIDFAAGKHLTVSSTYFPRKNIHKATWKSPDGRTANQIDHILIDTRHGSDIQNVRTCRGADIDSDHFLVSVKLKQRIARQKEGGKTMTPRFDSNKLINDLDMRKDYCEKIGRLLSQNEANDEKSINEEWEDTKNVIRKAAEDTIGYLKPQKRNPWFDRDCEKAIEDRNSARMKSCKEEVEPTRKYLPRRELRQQT